MSEYIAKCNEVVGISGKTLIVPDYIDTSKEIVRCRDCAKWHYFDDEDGVRYGECDEWKRADSHCMPATRENGFCAWGKRKEGGDD